MRQTISTIWAKKHISIVYVSSLSFITKSLTVQLIEQALSVSSSGA
jgi:hypothetical protein